VYGSVAILYTTYVFETEGPEGRKTTTGRGTETFVRREGRWVNTGWQVDDAG